MTTTDREQPRQDCILADVLGQCGHFRWAANVRAAQARAHEIRAAEQSRRAAILRRWRRPAKQARRAKRLEARRRARSARGFALYMAATVEHEARKCRRCHGQRLEPSEDRTGYHVGTLCTLCNGSGVRELTPDQLRAVRFWRDFYTRKREARPEVPQWAEWNAAMGGGP